MKVGWFAFVIARAVVEWVNARFSLVGDMPFFDPRQFEWVARVDAGWKSIHAELLGVLHDEAGIPSLQDIMPEQRTLEQPAWKTFVLYLSGGVALIRTVRGAQKPSGYSRTFQACRPPSFRSFHPARDYLPIAGCTTGCFAITLG